MTTLEDCVRFDGRITTLYQLAREGKLSLRHVRFAAGSGAPRMTWFADADTDRGWKITALTATHLAHMGVPKVEA